MEIELTRAERRRLEKLAGKKTTYQMTMEQIQEIKHQAVQEKKEEIQKEMNAYVQKRWEELVEETSGKNEEERMLKVLTLLMSVPARVLCEKFHWKPVKDSGDHRSKLLQFSEAVTDEVNRICSDENADIRKYRDETWKKYGVRYTVTEDGDLKKDEEGEMHRNEECKNGNSRKASNPKERNRPIKEKGQDRRSGAGKNHKE